MTDQECVDKAIQLLFERFHDGDCFDLLTSTLSQRFTEEQIIEMCTSMIHYYVRNMTSGYKAEVIDKGVRDVIWRSIEHWRNVHENCCNDTYKSV